MAALAYFITTLRDRFEDKERGATAIEYGLLAALVSIAIVAALLLLGPALAGIFDQVRAAL